MNKFYTVIILLLVGCSTLNMTKSQPYRDASSGKVQTLTFTNHTETNAFANSTSRTVVQTCEPGIAEGELDSCGFLDPQRNKTPSSRRGDCVERSTLRPVQVRRTREVPVEICNVRRVPRYEGNSRRETQSTDREMEEK